MPLDLTQLDADLDNIIADLPVSVTINGQTLTASRTFIQRAHDLIAEGTSDEYRFSIILNKSDLTTIPAPYETTSVVTLDSVDYDCLSTHEDEAGQLFRMDLGEEGANAG